MNKIYLDPEIFYVENFIEKKDLEQILIDCKNEKNWESSGVFLVKGNMYFSDKTNILINDKYRKKVCNLINDDSNVVNYQSIIQKYNKTEEEYSIRPHADRFDSDYAGTGEPTSKYVTKGYIMYYNDDYEGGEIVYVNKGIEFRPKSGMIIVHSGFEEYTHGVKKVSSGERYFSSGFVYEKDFFENNMI